MIQTAALRAALLLALLGSGWVPRLALAQAPPGTAPAVSGAPSSSLPAAAAAEAAAPRAAEQPEPPGGTGEVHVLSSHGRWNGRTGAYAFWGGVVAKRGQVTLRADEASLDPATNVIVATGHVLLTDPTRAIVADAVRAVLDGPVEASGVVAYVKEAPSPALTDAKDGAEARRAGRNRLTFTGRELEGEPSGRLHARDARVTLCDCGPDKAPSWELRASKADVIPGDRMILNWPVLYVTPRFLGVQKPVPVLVVPWLYLAIGDRHTGLLAPQVNTSYASRFSVAEPLFVTLGRSADLTFTPEWTAGRSRDQIAEGRPSVSGFGARLELRWAPAEGAEGELELHGVDDRDREPGGAGGGRLGLTGMHGQRLGPDTLLRVDLALASDPVWYRDLTADVLQRRATFSRSSAMISHRSEAVVLEASATYLEPLTPDARPAGLRFGAFGGAVPVTQRWPSLSATLLPVPLGPLLAQGRAGLSRFATLTGAEGHLGPADPGVALEVPTGWTAVPRPGVTRADARLELSWPLPLGPVSVAPFLRGAGAGYAYDQDSDPALTLWGSYGVTASLALARRAGGLEHRIEPRLELVGGTGLVHAGDVPLAGYDPWDRTFATTAPGGAPILQRLSAAPAGAYQQLRAAVVNRLDAGAGGHLQLELSQDFDLRRGVLAETAVRAGGLRSPLVGELELRFLGSGVRTERAPPPTYASPLDRLTQVRGNLGVMDARGDVLRAALVAVGPGGSPTSMAGPDAIFDLRPAPLGGVSQGSLGARGVLGGATVGYDVLMPGRPLEVGRCSGVGTRRIEAFHVQQHVASFAWNSPCRCFLARVVVRVNDCGEPSYSAQFDLSQLVERANIR